MNAYPMNQPLNILQPDVSIYVVRHGLAMPYPAVLLRDIANERYVVDAGPTPNPFELECGDRLAVHLAAGWQPTDPDRLKMLTLALWRNAGGGLHTFDLWWDSLDTAASASAIGTAAMVAARTTMTWSLFAHRCGLDVSAMNA